MEPAGSPQQVCTGKQGPTPRDGIPMFAMTVQPNTPSCAAVMYTVNRLLRKWIFEECQILVFQFTLDTVSWLQLRAGTDAQGVQDGAEPPGVVVDGAGDGCQHRAHQVSGDRISTPLLHASVSLPGYPVFFNPSQCGKTITRPCGPAVQTARTSPLLRWCTPVHAAVETLVPLRVPLGPRTTTFNFSPNVLCITTNFTFYFGFREIRLHEILYQVRLCRKVR